MATFSFTHTGTNQSFELAIGVSDAIVQITGVPECDGLNMVMTNRDTAKVMINDACVEIGGGTWQRQLSRIETTKPGRFSIRFDRMVGEDTIGVSPQTAPIQLRVEGTGRPVEYDEILNAAEVVREITEGVQGDREITEAARDIAVASASNAEASATTATTAKDMAVTARDEAVTAAALLAPFERELYVDLRAGEGGEYEYASAPMFATLAEAVEHARTLTAPVSIVVRPGSTIDLPEGDSIEGLTGEDIHITFLGRSDFGSTISRRQLVAWFESFQPVEPTFVDGLVTEAFGYWPDDSVGTLTILVRNAAFGNAVDSYSIYHDLSGKTVTQPVVTRNALGSVTFKPPLVVT